MLFVKLALMIVTFVGVLKVVNGGVGRVGYYFWGWRLGACWYVEGNASSSAGEAPASPAWLLSVIMIIIKALDNRGLLRGACCCFFEIFMMVLRNSRI